MSWTCSECGTPGNPDDAPCLGCNRRRRRALELERADGARLRANVRLRCNRSWARRLLGEGGRFWDGDCQLVLVPEEDGWYVEPNLEAVNETLLNEVPVTGRTRLKDGDVLAVGRAARRIAKTPLVVCLDR